MFVEFPKWIRRPGKREMLVDNADAEAAQFAAWDDEDRTANYLTATEVETVVLAPKTPSPNPLLSQLANGQPGGSLKGTGDDLQALRIAYKAKFGKKAFGGWDAAEITKRMEADA